MPARLTPVIQPYVGTRWSWRRRRYDRAMTNLMTAALPGVLVNRYIRPSKPSRTPPSRTSDSDGGLPALAIPAIGR